MNNGLRDAAEKLVNHDSLVILGHRVESLLDNMAAERVHGKAKCVATNCFRNLDDLLRGAVLETTLDEKVTEAIDHQWMGLKNDSVHNLILLVGCADLELLLEKDGGLLVIIAYYLVDNVLPIAIHVAVE